MRFTIPDGRRVRAALRVRLVAPLVGARSALKRRLRPPAPAASRPELDRVPVLIVGCHRSGTSLVRRCLDSHSRLAVPAETLFLEHLGAMVGVPAADDGLRAVGLDPDLVLEATRDRIRVTFEAYARSRGKPRWADKSPGIANQLPGVDRLLRGEALYVVVQRDGMDVACSLGGARPTWWQLEPLLCFEPDPYVAAAHYWVDLTTKILRFSAAHPARCHVVRYERLVTSPEPVLRELVAFLGEAWEPAMLDFNATPHSGGLEDHHVRTTTRFQDNTGKHRDLPIAVQRRMWEVVGPTMRQLGYGDRDYSAT